MTSMPPPDFDALKRALDAVSIIGQYVQLKRDGAQWKGLCPFHDDSSPSLSVSHEGYYCFGCGAKGDVIRFVQDIEEISAIESYRRLADDVGFRPGEIRPAIRERVTQQAKAPPVLREIGRLVAVYDYTDERGGLLYQVCRYDPKEFRQRRPNGAGGFEWKVKDVRQVLYHLAEVLKADTVHLCAGEKDADNLRILGFVATTNAGGEKRWDDSFAEALRGRAVIIWTDNDKAGVDRETRLLRKLASVTKSLRAVRTPQGKDVSEWIENGATKAMIEGLVRLSPECSKRSYRASGTEKFTPNDIGRMILEKHKFMCGEKGYYYEYNGQYWELRTETAIEAYANQIDAHDNVSRRRCSEAASFVMRDTYTPSIVWNRLEPNEIALQNGVLNLRLDFMREHRPEDNLETVIPHNWGGSTDCPTWMGALDRYFAGDEDKLEKTMALQEFMGYCLMTHSRYKKCLILEGDANCGKSQVLSVVEMILGSEHICSIQPGDMDDPRNLEPLIGKRANIVHDLPSDTVIADGGFKSLIDTEHGVNIKPMYRSPIQYRSIAKHIFGCNRRPRVFDLTGGVYIRMLCLRFNNPIPKDEQDPFFADKLAAEGQGILAWCVIGSKRLLAQNGRFTEPASTTAFMAEYREEQNPLCSFLEMYYERPAAEDAFSADHLHRYFRVKVMDLRKAYSEYLHKPISTQSFNAQLKAAGFVTERDTAGSDRFVTFVKGLKRKVENRYGTDD